MKAKITVDMDNAAFDDGANFELARILKDLVEKLDNSPHAIRAMNGTRLYDVNGNAVGELTIVGR